MIDEGEGVQPETIRAVCLPLDGDPVAFRLENSLKGMQGAIGGGYVEDQRIDEDHTTGRRIALFFDEDGSSRQLPRNRTGGKDRGFLGPGFVAASIRGRLVDLTPEEIAKIREIYRLENVSYETP